MIPRRDYKRKIHIGIDIGIKNLKKLIWVIYRKYILNWQPFIQPILKL